MLPNIDVTVIVLQVANRERCVMVVHAYPAGDTLDRASVSITVISESAGNWSAILFAVAISTITLACVIALGCYSDIQELRSAAKKAKATKANRNSVEPRVEPMVLAQH